MPRTKRSNSSRVGHTRCSEFFRMLDNGTIMPEGHFVFVIRIVVSEDNCPRKYKQERNTLQFPRRTSISGLLVDL